MISWSVAQVALAIAASMVVFILAAVAVLETAFRYEMRHGPSDGDSWKRVLRYTICPLCCLGFVILPIIVPLGAWVGEYARQRSYSTEELRSVNAATEVVTNILGKAAATVVPADVGRRRPWLYGLIDRGVETYSRLLPGAEEDTSSVDRASASYSDSNGFRWWDHCIFQSLRNDPVDRVVLKLLGGIAPDLESQCTVWTPEWAARERRAANGTKSSCRCAAPLRLLSSQANGQRTFVEIGANDGLHMSNSFFFERYLGWRGLCIEANPLVHQRLMRYRPKCISVNALVRNGAGVERGGGRKKSVPFKALYNRPGHRTRRDHGGNSNWQTGLSGVAVARSAAEAARQSDVLTNSTSAERFTAQHGLAITTIDLPTVPFWKLLAQNGFTRVDLMSVDVEGDEEAVIRSIDFRRVDIRLLVVERPSERLVAFLLAAGFVERTGEIVKPIATGQGLGDRVFLGAREAQAVHGRGPRAGGRGRPLTATPVSFDGHKFEDL